LHEKWKQTNPQPSNTVTFQHTLAHECIQEKQGVRNPSKYTDRQPRKTQTHSVSKNETTHQTTWNKMAPNGGSQGRLRTLRQRTRCHCGVLHIHTNSCRGLQPYKHNHLSETSQSGAMLEVFHRINTNLTTKHIYHSDDIILCSTRITNVINSMVHVS